MRSTACLLLTVCFAFEALAVPVRVDFEGEVSENPFGSIEVGDSIRGTLIYDPTAPPVSGPGSTTFESVLAYSFAIGGFQYEMVGTGTVFAFDDASGGDALGFSSEPGHLDGPAMSGLAPEGIFLLLEGADPGFFTQPNLPTRFDESDFGETTFAFSFGPSGPTGILTDVSAAPIPEPSAAALFGLGALIVGTGVRRSR